MLHTENVAGGGQTESFQNVGEVGYGWDRINLIWPGNFPSAYIGWSPRES